MKDLPCNILRISYDSEIVCRKTLGHVVVLSSPAPELVGVPVHLPHHLGGQGGHAAKQPIVGQLVLELFNQ